MQLGHFVLKVLWLVGCFDCGLRRKLGRCSVSWAERVLGLERLLEAGNWAAKLEIRGTTVVCCDQLVDALSSGEVPSVLRPPPGCLICLVAE